MNRDLLQLQFSVPLLNWFDIKGRKNLPWKAPGNPYIVWISEIMLQQTQVQTVIPYFERFINKFPQIWNLAKASDDEVLSLWSGLGYYSRARNLHKTAQIIVHDYNGEFPKSIDLLVQLPGIGASTAAAILSQAFNEPTAILDANVKRVLCRYFLISGVPDEAKVKKHLWELAQNCMPSERCAEYTQAIMDLGALCCTPKNPNCTQCPVQSNCLAYKDKVQELYPSKKSKKNIPQKSEQFLVLYNDQKEIYLEKRPPIGLWGGLWCFPALDLNENAHDYIQKKYSLSSDKIEKLLSFTHRFSHFQLEIHALSMRTKSIGNMVAESNGQWVSRESLHQLGLAKPTSLILAKWYQGS